MTKGQLAIGLGILLAFAACLWLSGRVKNPLAFSAAFFGAGGLWAVLCGWFAYDCLVVNPTAEGFYFIPVIRFMLQNDDYAYPRDFWPALVWGGIMALLCCGFGLLFVLRRRRAAQ